MNCNIKVLRFVYTPESTISQVWFNDTLFGYALEDYDRGLRQDMSLEEITETKVYGKTAIPTGSYELIVNHSNRFDKDLPLLLNVPGFEGIRIHAGNFAKDSHGCLLLGSSFGRDVVKNSKATMAKLMELLKDCGKTTVIISRK